MNESHKTTARRSSSSDTEQRMFLKNHRIMVNCPVVHHQDKDRQPIGAALLSPCSFGSPVDGFQVRLFFTAKTCCKALCCSIWGREALMAGPVIDLWGTSWLKKSWWVQSTLHPRADLKPEQSSEPLKPPSRILREQTAAGPEDATRLMK